MLPPMQLYGAMRAQVCMQNLPQDKIKRPVWPSEQDSNMLTEQVLVAGASACVTVLGAIRLSRCTRIKCCCVECERKVVGEDARDSGWGREAQQERCGEESPSEDGSEVWDGEGT